MSKTKQNGNSEGNLYHLRSVPRRRVAVGNWTTSYGDLVSLLLVFFVILVSASNIKASKFEQIQKALSGVEEQENPIEQIIKDLSGTLEQHGLSEWVQIIEDEEGVLLIIKDNLLFDSGKASILPENQEKFRPVLQALKELPPIYHFDIEGHTDDVPIRTQQFASNWYLSSARALSILDLFIDLQFDESRLSARGFASQKPLVPNRDKEEIPIPENQKKNRRVAIRIR